MILVGLFSFANSRSCEMSSCVQVLPMFLVALVIDISPRIIITEPFADTDNHGRVRTERAKIFLIRPIQVSSE